MTERNAGRYHVTGAVMAHPRRRVQAEELSARLPADLRGVVTDPDPDGPPLELRTAVRAWSSIPAHATHHLLVHDDMAVAPGMLERITGAVRARPDAALSLFAFWGSRNGAAVRQAALAGARWVRAVNEWTPTNALVLPRDVAEGFARWAERSGSSWPVDVMLHRFLRQQGVPAYVAVPNLMEHEELGSLVNNDYQGLRRSACFLPGGVPEADEAPAATPCASPFFVAFDTPSAQVAVPVPGTDGRRSRHIQCAEYLDQFGIDVADLRAWSRPEVAGVDDETAWAVWLTAFTTGLVNRLDGHGRAGLDDAVVRAALGTIVQGGISHTTDAGTAQAVARALWTTIADGVQAGLATPARRTRGTSSGPRIRVSGEDTYVGEYLSLRLSELGRLAAPEPDDAAVTVLTGPAAWASGTDVDAAAIRGQTDRTRDFLATYRGRVVLLSSLRVYATDTGPVDEYTEPAAGDPVAAAIRELERLCLDAGAIVLRLGLPYGPGLPPGNDLTDMVGNASTSRPFAASRAGWPMQLVHLKDVAAAVVAAADLHGTGSGADRVFTIAGRPLAVPDLADVVFRVVRPVENRSPATEPGPVAATDLAGKVLGWRETVAIEHGVHGFSQWLAHETTWEPR